MKNETKTNRKKRQNMGSLEEKTYTYGEVLEASTEYFKGDTLAANVWMNKYALKNSERQFI